MLRDIKNSFKTDSAVNMQQSKTIKRPTTSTSRCYIMLWCFRLFLFFWH